MEPCLAWAHIRLLAKGESAHHQKKTTMAMHLPDGSRAANASTNMSAFSPHFNQVYNNHHATDLTLLEQVSQRCTLWELDDPISWEEFSKAVMKLKKCENSRPHRGPAGSI